MHGIRWGCLGVGRDALLGWNGMGSVGVRRARFLVPPGKEVSMGNMVPISPMRCYNACTQRLEIASPDNSPQHSPQRLLRKRLSETSSLAAAGREGMEGQCRERVSRSQEEAGAVPCPKPGTQRRQHQSPPDMSTYPGCALTSDSSSDKEMAAEVTTKASRKRKGKKQQRGSALRHQMAPEDVLFEERYHFRNQMYTACKTGNINDVRNLLAIISGVTETPTPTNPPALGDPTSSSLSSAELPTPTNSLFKDLPSSSHAFSMEPPTPCNSSTDFSTSYYPPSSSQYPLSSQPPSILVTLDDGAGSSGDPPRECDSSETLKDDLASLSNTSNSPEGTSPSNVASTCSCPETTTNEAVTPAGQVVEDVSLRATAAGQGGIDDQGSSSKGDAIRSPTAAQTSGQASAGSSSMHQGSRVPNKDDLTTRLTKLSCSQNGRKSAGGKGTKCSEGSLGVSDSSPSVPLSQPSTSSSSATNWSLPLVSQQSRGLMMSPLSPISACDILNETFGDNGTTMLHVAAKEGHKAVVRALMLAGADPAVRDKQGRTPYTFATDKETKKEFRRFMAAFPDRYNYSKAQIPSPLTAEMEQEKRQKEAERKKEKKKAQKERMQAKKAEQLKAQKEEEERNKFLALSDREKRALAAERRLQQQLSGSSTEQAGKPVLRCWKCGADISGKAPFTYSDFKFCSIKCLQQHRADNQKS